MLPESPKICPISPWSLVAAAKQGMDAVSQALARGELSIHEGDISLPKLEKEEVPPSVERKRSIFRTLPRARVA